MEDAARPWTAFYGPHVRPEIETASHRILPDLIGGVAETYRSAPAFTCVLPNGMNGTLSFAQVDEMSDALAIYLREVAGLGAGDRVAVQMPNCLGFPVAAFAVFKAGCVLVNVNPLYTAEEMGKQFEDAEPHALIIIDMFADKVPVATRGHPIPNIIVTRVAEFFPSMPRGHRGAGAEILGPLRRADRTAPYPPARRHRRGPCAPGEGPCRGLRLQRSIWSPTMSPCSSIPVARPAFPRARC
jgi:long-chain acyl-CoA synthetase